MKRVFNYLIISLIIIIVNFLPGNSQSGKIKQVKLIDFDLQSSALITATGAEISTIQYNSNVYWFPVKVPCTVLTGLVANKVYPDPYSGLNNMLIPDASDEFNKKYNLEQFSHLPNNPNPWKDPYWYRATFKVPLADKGRHFQLIFKGINYRAAVWVNGKQISDSTEMAGMFAEYSLDVSGIIKAGKENALAVKIYPLDFPGLPSTEQCYVRQDGTGFLQSETGISDYGSRYIYGHPEELLSVIRNLSQTFRIFLIPVWQNSH
jgi:hypothetical protein